MISANCRSTPLLFPPAIQWGGIVVPAGSALSTTCECDGAFESVQLDRTAVSRQMMPHRSKLKGEEMVIRTASDKGS